MKKVLWIAFLTGYVQCFAQSEEGKLEFKEHISKQIALQKSAATSVFALYNVLGSIKVEGYNGNQVNIEIDKTIIADNTEDMVLAKKEFKLGFDQKADSIIAYTAEPYDTRPNSRWNNDGNRKRRYIVKLEYTVKVPNNMNIRISTVNSNDVNIKDVYGQVTVNNVNGSIAIINAKGTTDARTVNGDLTINYLAIPLDASNYYTLNGEMQITYPASLAADIQFKSMNGQFYTDFTNVEVLPMQSTNTGMKKDNSTIYKLNKNKQIRIGAGGMLFKFETLNGNIYIKKA